jgi:hypothetical protein
MMTYDPDLPGCFGPDLKFASGDRERDRAFRWLAKLRARRATWADARMQIEEFLRPAANDAPFFQIMDEVGKAEQMFAPWLWEQRGSP